MADTELEALNEIIGQNNTIISNQDELILNQEEIITGLNLSGESNYIEDIISNQTLFHDLFINELEENKIDILVLNTTPIYTEEEIIEQNTFVWENLQEIKEMQFSNYVIVGVLIAIGVFIAVKGLFKNVT